MNLYAPQPEAIPFEFGDVVWLKNDINGTLENGGIVAGILFKPGAIMIQVLWGVNCIDYHYLFELTKIKPREFANDD